MVAELLKIEEQGDSSEKDEKTKKTLRKQVLSFLFKNYLPLSLVFLVLFGIFVPQPGLFLSKGPTHFICIVCLFFHSGIKLKTGEVKEAFKSIKALCFGIVSILFITTTIGVSLTSLLPFDVEAGEVVLHFNGNASSAKFNTTSRPEPERTRSIFGPQAFKIGLQIYFIVPCTIAAGVVMVSLKKCNILILFIKNLVKLCLFTGNTWITSSVEFNTTSWPEPERIRLIFGPQAFIIADLP